MFHHACRLQMVRAHFWPPTSRCQGKFHVTSMRHEIKVFFRYFGFETNVFHATEKISTTQYWFSRPCHAYIRLFTGGSLRTTGLLIWMCKVVFFRLKGHAARFLRTLRNFTNNTTSKTLLVFLLPSIPPESSNQNGYHRSNWKLTHLVLNSKTYSKKTYWI